MACVKTNCPGPYHDYDAMDIGGEFGDPIYAAGVGILHIGGTDRSCPQDGPTAGTWVWIDHGPAGRTRYSHLNSIEAVEGQLVTPDTVIGTMGNTGSKYPCAGPYLHLEYRSSAGSLTRFPVPTLQACYGGATLRYPEDLGYSEWDLIPAGPQSLGNRVFTLDSDNSCFPSSWSLTPDKPTAKVEPGVEQLKITPSARAGDVDQVRVRLEQYHPTVPGFGSAIDRTLPPTQNATTFTGLIAGKTYRARVSFHNDAGWSAWSEPVVDEPGKRLTPPLLRELEWTRTSIKYRWHRAPNGDAGYDVRIRRANGATWGPWTKHAVTEPAINYRFADLDPGIKYQVTVRARNEFGKSDWAPTQTVTTLGCESACSAGPRVFTPLEPARFADSRNMPTFDNQYRNTGPRAGGTTWEIAVAGRNGVPLGATAAIVNLTVLNGVGPGFATVYPCGVLPTASSVNYVPGAVEPNEVIAKLSPRGSICVYTLTTADVIVDVVGHVTDSTYHPLTPRRYADSRAETTFDGKYRATGRRRGGTTWEIQIAGRGGVPASAVTAALNVTVTGGIGPGFATLYPCGERPVASSLNYDVGITRPNELVAKLSPDGMICVYTLTDVDVIVDVVGYAGDVVGFTPLTPIRVADSRDESTVDNQYRNTGRRRGGTTWEIPIEGRAGLRSVESVIANITVTDALAPGFVTVYQCGARPVVSSLNYFVGTTRPNETIAKLSADGKLCVFTSASAHIIVDVVGFTDG